MQHFTSYESLITLLLSIHVILYLQSGFDKVINFSSNLEWLNGHFSKSIFKNNVRILLSILTLMEIITGLASITGIAAIIFQNYLLFASLAMMFSLITLTSLFLGQRIAKDYAGAASLIPYILLSLATYVIINYYA